MLAWHGMALAYSQVWHSAKQAVPSHHTGAPCAPWRSGKPRRGVAAVGATAPLPLRHTLPHRKHHCGNRSCKTSFITSYDQGAMTNISTRWISGDRHEGKAAPLQSVPLIYWAHWLAVPCFPYVDPFARFVSYEATRYVMSTLTHWPSVSVLHLLDVFTVRINPF